MAAPIKILLVDQATDNLAKLKRSLSNFTDLDVVGEVGFGPAALTWARNLQPDVVLIAAEEPLARALGAIRSLAQGGPTWTIVAMTPQFEGELFRQLVLAGAGDVVQRGIPPDTLASAIISARQADLTRRAPTEHGVTTGTGTILTVFGAKGGIGKTLVATNLAISLAVETSRSVALVDLDLPLGDVAMLLDLKPERDILNALDATVVNDAERLQTQLTTGPGGVLVLPSPSQAYESRPVSGEEAAHLVTRLAALYDYVVVDTPPGLSEITAAALDVSTVALVVTTPEVPCLRRTQASLSMLQHWDFATHRVKLVLNRAASKTNVSADESEMVLNYPISWRIANDYAAMKGAAFGKPVVLHQPDTLLASDIRFMARQLAGLPPDRVAAAPSRGLAGIAAVVRDLFR